MSEPTTAADPLVTQLWTAFEAVGEQVQQGADWEEMKPALGEQLREQAVREDIGEYVLTCLEEAPEGPVATLAEVLERRSTFLYDVAAVYGQPAVDADYVTTPGQEQGAWGAPGQEEYAGLGGASAAGEQIEQPALQVGARDESGAWEWDGREWVAAGTVSAPVGAVGTVDDALATTSAALTEPQAGQGAAEAGPAAAEAGQAAAEPELAELPAESQQYVDTAVEDELAPLLDDVLADLDGLEGLSPDDIKEALAAALEQSAHQQ